MILLPNIEKIRAAEQIQLDAYNNPQERNRTGQFATPFSLALQIASYAHSILNVDEMPVRFLEPAVGTGTFLSALRSTFAPQEIARTLGVEVDPAIMQVTRRLWETTQVELIQADFTHLAPHFPNEFNLILANPPYVRHHHLSASLKASLYESVRRETGHKINGLAGLYCYFILLAHRWLSDNGLAIWLIPSEFMDVKYGSVLRNYLTENVTLIRIHRARPDELQFEDALVSSAIVIYRKSPPPANHQVQFSLGGSLPTPEFVNSVPLNALIAHPKWTKFGHSSVQTSHNKISTVCLGDLFEIKRGIATGANAFFIMTRAQAVQHGLPEQFLKPILPSPRYLKENVIETDDDGYPRLPQQHVLLDCPLPSEQIKQQFPKLDAYLTLGKMQGLHNRYLAKHRNLWYRQEYRPVAPFLCTYMGRNLTSRVAIRFFWNQSQALATNVYLLLYPQKPLAAALQLNPDLYAQVLNDLSKIDLSLLLGEGRVYGGALHKIEPKELGRVPLFDAENWVTLGKQLPLF